MKESLKVSLSQDNIQGPQKMLGTFLILDSVNFPPVRQSRRACAEVPVAHGMSGLVVFRER